jgi:Rhodopirellula transposase DDE domain
MKSLPYESISNRYSRLKDSLSEQMRRLWAASEAIELGYGGISAVARATGLMPATIRAGIAEITTPPPTSLETKRGQHAQRKPGGGRKSLEQHNPQLIMDLEKLMEPYTSGDPMRPLRWTCKSTSELARELTKQGHRISADTVGRLLKARNYSLQGNRKRFEGKQHPDRNAQFEYIAATVEAFQGRACPVISVDTKKKELVGNYKNGGQEWAPRGEATDVEAYDFVNADLGKAIPYGIYDPSQNLGWVSVGTDHDTAQFAVRSIGHWWEEMGEYLYPEAKEILIMCDGGGSNATRSRLWKKSLQDWADQEGITVTVCHFPPGTSKWNKIEHRMFCHITRNWRGKPLISHEVIIALIGATTTSKGLSIRAQLDTSTYPLGVKVSDDEFSALSIQRADFHGEWNYTISPRV